MFNEYAQLLRLCLCASLTQYVKLALFYALVAFLKKIGVNKKLHSHQEKGTSLMERSQRALNQ